ncbi:unnamed protein product [Didymodactylos carnosus]|uniref:Uncharacterized protein n=1 Tax=Didymodactylos carnosus TaxID=1234261 RepID=A0A813R9G0_9BILA|nr:unnamed protein product [Didymodactylos carnosus]CAF3561686.1 unnamed protein product [Didymodactylos carnosus]
MSIPVTQVKWHLAALERLGVQHEIINSTLIDDKIESPTDDKMLKMLNKIESADARLIIYNGTINWKIARILLDCGAIYALPRLYRRFITAFSQLATPLTDLEKADRDFN